mgnify:CR=1 FL=1
MEKPAAARILIDCSLVPENNWCWRPEWYCGSDSVYCLLAKFGSLNVLSVRELCELFVQRNPLPGSNGRGGRPHFPVVDLRYAKDLRVARLANLLKLDAGQIQLGFVDVRFPNAAQIASSNLVWCPACARRGFHCPAFQLNYVSVCPLHGHALLSRCTKCSSPLPYRLNATIRYELFCCPNCRTDFAPALRSPRRTLEMDPSAATLFADHSELIHFSDGLPTMINACKAALGKPHMPLFMGRPHLYRSGVSFRQFVTDVLTSVSNRTAGQAQTCLDLLVPSVTFLDRSQVQAKRVGNPPLASVKSAVRSVAQATDKRLEEAWAVYRAVRRYLWRHHVCQHRSCARLAMKTLWWDLEGEKTHSFCCVALAFIRWRMQWEGRRVPASLGSSGRGGVPYGLLGWVSKDAPIPSAYWSPAFESWLNAHLLGAACLDSFTGWITLSARQDADQYVRWKMRAHEVFSKRHWACSGRGDSKEPGLLFLEEVGAKDFSLANSAVSYKFTRAHRCGTAQTLAQMRR